MGAGEYYPPSPDKDHWHRLAGGLYHVNRPLDVLDHLGDRRLHERLLQLLRAGDIDPGVLGYLCVAVGERHVRGGDCAPAPGDPLRDDVVPDTVRSNRYKPIHISHDAPATVAHRDEVGHPEVCPDATHLDGAGRLPGKPLDENPCQGRRPAYVDDDGFVEPCEESRSAYAVGGPRKDRKDGVPLRVFHGHQRAVVLAEEELRPDRPPLERLLQGARRRLRHLHRRRVEDCRVLPLDEPDDPDLMGERDGNLPADHLPQGSGRLDLLVVPHWGELPGYRDGIELLLDDRSPDFPEFRGVESIELSPVVLVPALYGEVRPSNRSLQVLGPVDHRLHPHPVRRESRLPVEGGVPQLQGDVISLEVEVPRTPNLEGLRGPHYLRGRYPHYGDPEAIPEPLRRDRASGLCVQNRDEVRDCRD